MTQYTSTKAGFQRLMELVLAGKPEDAKVFADEIATPSFYQILNGARIERQAWVDKLVDMRVRIQEWEPVIEEFLRDGNQLACRMTGVLKLAGYEKAFNDMKFESFIFVGVDKQSGRMTYMIERGVRG